MDGWMDGWGWERSAGDRDIREGVNCDLGRRKVAVDIIETNFLSHSYWPGVEKKRSDWHLTTVPVGTIMLHPPGGVAINNRLKTMPSNHEEDYPPPHPTPPPSSLHHRPTCNKMRRCSHGRFKAAA